MPRVGTKSCRGAAAATKSTSTRQAAAFDFWYFVLERDDVVYWKTNRKIKNDLHFFLKSFFEVSPKKNPAQAGWPKRLGHVGTTQWADFAVITAQLWSIITAIFFLCDNFLKKLLSSTNNRELLSTPKEIYDLNLSVSWVFGHFEPNIGFSVPNNCTILGCFHPLAGTQASWKGKDYWNLAWPVSLPTSASKFSSRLKRYAILCHQTRHHLAWAIIQWYMTCTSSESLRADQLVTWRMLFSLRTSP